METNRRWKTLYPGLIPYVKENKKTVTVDAEYFDELITEFYNALASFKSDEFFDTQELRVKQVNCLIDIIKTDTEFRAGDTFNIKAQEVIITKLGEILSKME